MNKPTNMNPGGGKILPCVDDAACEITSCEICMKEVPRFRHTEGGGGGLHPLFLRTGLPGNLAAQGAAGISFGCPHLSPLSVKASYYK